MHRKQSQWWIGAWLLVALACCRPMAVRADEGTAPKAAPWRNAFWFSASATLLSASLAGVYALRVSAIYDRSRELPPVSPELTTLHHDAERAERTADALFISTAVFATTSVILWIVSSHGTDKPAPTLSLAAAATPRGAALVWRGSWQ